MTAETLVLLGGPQDGKLITVTNPPLNEYRIPIPPDLYRSLTEPEDSTSFDSDFHMGIYKPRIDGIGHISRNDSGQLVYLWQGIR